ncbi:MAG: hypothetical protein ABI604_04035 [Nitrospirota bacterium]
MKNIIFKDIKIAYEGGRVEMENVYFVNCSFEVTRRPNGQNFASSVVTHELFEPVLLGGLA